MASTPDLGFNLVDVFHAAIEYGRALAHDGPNSLLTARARFLYHLNPRRRAFGTDRDHLLELAYPGTRCESLMPSYFDEVDLWINLNTNPRKTDARNALSGRRVAPLHGLHCPSPSPFQFFSGSVWSCHTPLYASADPWIALPMRDSVTEVGSADVVCHGRSFHVSSSGTPPVHVLKSSRQKLRPSSR
jgi:hypothetical protein